MAAIAFFLLILTLSSTIHARESQFFNKQSQHLTTDHQQPDFIPQSHDSASYGLYGQLSPSATTTTNLPENYNPVAYTTPIHSSTQDIPNEYKDDPQPYQYNGETRMYNSEKQGMSDTNGRYYDTGSNAYSSQKQGFDDARLMETQDGGNMYNSEKQEQNGRYNQDAGMYNSQRQGVGETQYSTSSNANMYNGEKQGMSDTRFLENGKYYYDVNMENLNSRNEYNTQGYYGNNENSYDRYNSNLNGGGYQNQEDRFNP